MTAADTEWVAGFTSFSGQTKTYYNRQYNSCGSDNSLMCGNNYYINTTLAGGAGYSVCDRQLENKGCWWSDPCPIKGTCIDHLACPNIAQIQAQPQWSFKNNGTGGANMFVDPPSQNFNNKYPGQIACVYPISFFYDLDSVSTFRSFFSTSDGYNNDAYDKQILPSYCLTSQTTSCPEDPLTGLPMKACSRFISTDPDDPCPDWLARTYITDKAATDVAKKNYCAAFNTPDCLCINRQYNPAYQIMSAAQTTTSQDNCWWVPCQDITQPPVSYLVPSEFIDNKCESDAVVCNNINVVLGGNSSGLTFNPDAYTSCNINEQPDDGGGGNNPPIVTETTIWSQYSWLCILILFIVIIVAVLLTYLI